MLLSKVNISYYPELTAGARAAIAAGWFAEFHAPPRPAGTGGDHPPNANSISAGLDGTPSADAQ
jgi:queuine tRNA-ribosyltransferase